MTLRKIRVRVPIRTIRILVLQPAQYTQASHLNDPLLQWVQTRKNESSLTFAVPQNLQMYSINGSIIFVGGIFFWPSKGFTLGTEEGLDRQIESITLFPYFFFSATKKLGSTSFTKLNQPAN